MDSREQTYCCKNINKSYIRHILLFISQCVHVLAHKHTIGSRVIRLQPKSTANKLCVAVFELPNYAQDGTISEQYNNYPLLRLFVTQTVCYLTDAVSHITTYGADALLIGQ